MSQNPPRNISMLAAPIITDNFMPQQSAALVIGTGAVANSLTFTAKINPNRVTYKFFNSGTKDAFVSVGPAASIVAAVAATATPQPTSTLVSISICDCIPHGAIITQDYPGGYDTVSGICASGDNTTLQITLGAGQ